MRTHVTPPARFASQQTTELRGLAWAVRFAVRTGHKSVTVFSDSEAAIAQVLRLRATSHLSHHQAVLRSLARVLWVSGIVVRLVWVPSALQPGDLMSRVASVFGGSQARAEVEAWRTWDALLDNLGEARVKGGGMPTGILTPPRPPPKQSSGGSACALRVAPFFRTYAQASGLAWGPQATGFLWSPPEGSPWRIASPAIRGGQAATGGEVDHRAPRSPTRQGGAPAHPPGAARQQGAPVPPVPPPCRQGWVFGASGPGRGRTSGRHAAPPRDPRRPQR